jgi:hypothetical protein
MAQGLPRTRFNSSKLVGVLADLAVADVPESKQPFAERLGQWLSFTDALTLFSALNPGPAGAAEVRSGASSSEGAAARQALARVRGILVEAITGGEGRFEGSASASREAMESVADFAPYHRYYLARQRDMSANIGPLRATLRAALSRQSPALRRLAVLDAVLDQALAARERDLLATVPAFLGRRFEALRQAHQATLAEARTADDPQRWVQPGGWLAEFHGEMQSVLLAELDLRLQPIAGLISALDKR